MPSTVRAVGKMLSVSTRQVASSTPTFVIIAWVIGNLGGARCSIGATARDSCLLTGWAMSVFQFPENGDLLPEAIVVHAAGVLRDDLLHLIIAQIGDEREVVAGAARLALGRQDEHAVQAKRVSVARHQHERIMIGHHTTFLLSTRLVPGSGSPPFFLAAA